MERMGAFVQEPTDAGVIIGGDGLRPSAFGKRVRLKDGNFDVIDGPFTESKELIASYALFQVGTMDAPFPRCPRAGRMRIAANIRTRRFPCRCLHTRGAGSRGENAREVGQGASN